MEVKIIYSNRKTIGISVKEGNVIVRAPRGKSKSELELILKKHDKWIINALEREKKREELYQFISECDVDKIRKDARVYFTEKCRHYAEIMRVEYKKIRITSSKTRFGSCSSLGNINFSYRLMLYPEAAREYVVVHELAHLTEMNHSKRFYNIVEKYMPDYKERRLLLKMKDK